MDVFGQRAGSEHAAPTQTESDETIVRVLAPVTVQGLYIRDIERVLVILPLRPSVRKTRPYARLR